MAMEKSQPGIGLTDLRKAAKRKDWDLVDAQLSVVANDSATLRWSLNSGLRSSNAQLRDLAVSVLERTAEELKPKVTKRLLTMFDDSNPYVGFRSAFALFSHGDRSPKVLEKIREAVGDEEVREIAEGYLAQL